MKEDKLSKEFARLVIFERAFYLLNTESIEIVSSQAQKIFKNIGSASILMNVNTGEILSMISLPDFDLNKREEIKDVNYINRATKGVYELGSVFKTFTFAAGLNERLNLKHHL